MNTYVYFTYLRCYPCLNPVYRVALHTLYCASLAYQLLHNVNRLSFQFENLIMMLEMQN